MNPKSLHPKSRFSLFSLLISLSLLVFISLSSSVDFSSTAANTPQSLCHLLVSSIDVGDVKSMTKRARLIQKVQERERSQRERSCSQYQNQKSPTTSIILVQWQRRFGMETSICNGEALCLYRCEWLLRQVVQTTLG